MKQKEIWWANLNPVKGREQGGLRPVLILSGDAMNKKYDVIIICPLSTKVKNFSGCYILKKNKLNHLEKDSEIIVFQIRTIAKNRLTSKIGEITNEELFFVKFGLNQILTY